MKERTTKYLKMQGEELLHNTWTLWGDSVALLRSAVSSK